MPRFRRAGSTVFEGLRASWARHRVPMAGDLLSRRRPARRRLARRRPATHVSSADRGRAQVRRRCPGASGQRRGARGRLLPGAGLSVLPGFDLRARRLVSGGAGGAVAARAADRSAAGGDHRGAGGVAGGAWSPRCWRPVFLPFLFYGPLLLKPTLLLFLETAFLAALLRAARDESPPAWSWLAAGWLLGLCVLLRGNLLLLVPAVLAWLWLRREPGRWRWRAERVARGRAVRGAGAGDLAQSQRSPASGC